MKVYGIANCTTVRKARAWLDARGMGYVFVDFHRTPPQPAQLRHWVDVLGWERVLNRRGTTWRLLGPEAQAAVTDADGAIAAMLDHPSMIRRPVVEADTALLIGFDAPEYADRIAVGDQDPPRHG
ncbi:MAG: arsenate reductase [Casimicrobiaceae bacterium]